MNNIFTEQNLLILQIFLAILAVVLILMQNRGAGLSGAFGGRDEIYLTRRGIEKSVITLTVFAIVGFIVVRIVALYI